jgi:CheY-like chemotaxis protein
MGTRLLERLGYHVAGYTRADDAVAAFRDHPAAFDLVITDYNMPTMSGMDVALSLMQVRPDVPIVLASGFLRPAEIEHARALGIKATVAKPNTVEELGAVLRRLLHARREQ